MKTRYLIVTPLFSSRHGFLNFQPVLLTPGSTPESEGTAGAALVAAGVAAGALVAGVEAVAGVVKAVVVGAAALCRPAAPASGEKILTSIKAFRGSCIRG